MIKDIPVARLEFNFDKLHIVDIKKIYNLEKMPLISTGNDLTKEDRLVALNYWFKSRLMPEKRECIKTVIKLLKYDNIPESGNLITKIMPRNFSFASLSDCYWIRYNKMDLWEQKSFYRNPLSEDIGNLFFYPFFNTRKGINFNSPDLTTGGNLKKTWISDGKKQYLLKTGSQRFKTEPVNEVLVSSILRKLHMIPFVSYTFFSRGLEICCKCENFTTEQIEFVPAYHLYKTLDKEEHLTYYEHLKKCMEKWEIPDDGFIDKMIAVDFYTGNLDRHLNNFGFLRNSDTGVFLRPAPLFDFGSTSWGRKETDKKKGLRDIFKEETERCVNKYPVPADIDIESLKNEVEDILNGSRFIPKEQIEDIEENVKKILIGIEERGR